MLWYVGIGKPSSTMAGFGFAIGSAQLLRIYGFMNVKISESLRSQTLRFLFNSPSFPTDSVHVFILFVCVHLLKQHDYTIRLVKQ